MLVPMTLVASNPAGEESVAGDRQWAYPVKVRGKWGCIDRDGNVVVEPKFDYVSDCYEGRLPFNVGGSEKADADGVISHTGGRWGFLSWTGQTAVSATYAGVGIYREGYAAVQTDRGLGFIDKNGDMAIRPRFCEVRCFQEGLCAVQDASGRYGFIDRHGDMVIPARFEVVGNLCCGLAPVRIQRRFGFINHAGEVVIAATFAVASEFTADGLAKVLVERDGASPRIVFIDRDGKWVVQPKWVFHPEYGEVGHFSEGLASVLCEKGYGYMDTSGKVVIPGKYKQCFPFHDGLAGVDCGIGETKFGFIDKNGTMVIPPRRGVCLPFHGGLSQVLAGNGARQEVGYVDKAGKWVWPPTR
jgi:hypothetical protein